MIKRKMFKVWLVIWIVFYLVIMALNYSFEGSDLVKVLSCLGIGLNVIFVYYHSPKDYLLQIALAFTLLSDVIIAVNAPAFLCVFAFVFAQFFHFSRLAKLESKALLWFLVTMTSIVYIISVLGIEPTFAMGAFYACFLIGNITLSILWYRKTKSTVALCAMLGFLLFALCDTCVALSYFSRVGILPLEVAKCTDYMSWVFYYPSQIYIALSGKV